MSHSHLQHGGARLIELMVYDLDELLRHAGEARANIRRNPDICADALDDVQREAARLRRRIAEELRPMLERRAPRDELVQATEALRAALAHLEAEGKVIPLRRAEGGR